jgi:gamma-glutamyltranspeptidase
MRIPIRGLLCTDGRPRAVFGTMGGHAQLRL